MYAHRTMREVKWPSLAPRADVNMFFNYYDVLGEKVAKFNDPTLITDKKWYERWKIEFKALVAAYKEKRACRS